MKRSLVAGAAALMALAVFAEEDAELALPVIPTNTAPAVKFFTTLPLCRRVERGASVCPPGGQWKEAEEGRFYPFGTAFRAEKDGILVVAFGSGSTVTVRDGSEFGTRVQPVGEPSRTIVLVRGTVDLKLQENLSEGLFFVTAPGFQVKNPAGESKFTYADRGDGDEAVVRCVTGSLAVEGRHFAIPMMHAANEVKIRTSRDHLTTILYGTSGDYAVKLDQGLRNKEEFDDEGKIKLTTEKGELEWHLTPFTKIVINRSLPAIGERMSVHTMAFDAAGERKSECYFCEGRAEVNSGELVVADKVNGEDLAKRAAEMTETTAATDAEETEEKPAEEASSGESGSTSNEVE